MNTTEPAKPRTFLSGSGFGPTTAMIHVLGFDKLRGCLELSVVLDIALERDFGSLTCISLNWCILQFKIQT